MGRPTGLPILPLCLGTSAESINEMRTTSTRLSRMVAYEFYCEDEIGGYHLMGILPKEKTKKETHQAFNHEVDESSFRGTYGYE